MICSKCGKPLKRGYFFNSKPYGPECIKKVAGRMVNLRKLPEIKIEKATDSEQKQMELFDER